MSHSHDGARRERRRYCGGCGRWFTSRPRFVGRTVHSSPFPARSESLKALTDLTRLFRPLSRRPLHTTMQLIAARECTLMHAARRPPGQTPTYTGRVHTPLPKVAAASAFCVCWVKNNSYSSYSGVWKCEEQPRGPQRYKINGLV